LNSHPIRFLRVRDKLERQPAYAVWELTLQCNLKCGHCGSRAGEQRSNELDPQEALDLVDQLAELGVRELAIIGGEAYLRRDWIDIVERARSRGIRPVLQTGGLGFTKKLASRAKAAGLAAVGVSIDGIEHVHDQIRGVDGSFQSAIQAIKAAKEIGLVATANTQIHAKNWSNLNELFEILAHVGITAWQVQLTVAMGNAADNDALLLQPYLLDMLFPNLARLFDECENKGIQLQAGNNIGYFGPYEHLWRGPARIADHYEGCQAGIGAIGIEADGTIKGCPSLATSRFAEGNIRTRRLREIWEDKRLFRLNQTGSNNLWGFCKSCYYAESCRGGCVWTSDSLLGRPGNNPFCHHRVISLKAQGVRERIEKVCAAEKSSFGVGLFKVIQEPWVDLMSTDS
jgi:radical SAM protein with 4Fe4S-binding SPASM domain